MSVQAVRLANRAAAALAPHDARLILASLTARSIEGGRAAIIRPEVRRRLVTRAQSMGLRPFDANLIIAIVQDDARSGPHLSHSTSSPRSAIGRDTDPAHLSCTLSADARDRLTLVHATPPATSHRAILTRFAIALALGIASAYALIRWILSA